jgi:hypothetical protein
VKPHRCRECTLLRIDREGYTSEECLKTKPYTIWTVPVAELPAYGGGGPFPYNIISSTGPPPEPLTLTDPLTGITYTYAYPPPK